MAKGAPVHGAPYRMSYRELYERVQPGNGRVSTRQIKDIVKDVTGITAVKEVWTGVIDETKIRGFYIEGPVGPPVPLAANEVLIVLPRSLTKDWRRVVYAKELMHAFDEPDEKADTRKKFDRQIERIADPTAAMSPQFLAEVKALWRALGVLCSESARAEFRSMIAERVMSDTMVAAQLRIPELFIGTLVREDFEDIIDTLKD